MFSLQSIEKIIKVTLGLKPFKLFNHLITDLVYAQARRNLLKIPAWRFGTTRVHNVTSQFIEYLTKHTSLEGKAYLDLGCGKHHPFGSSLIMYLNGIDNAVAFDLEKYYPVRPAEAMYELLADCALNPEKWMADGTDKSAFYERIANFDTDALQKGDLENGLKSVSFRAEQGNIDKPPFEKDTFDIVTSRSVLEHFYNFELAVKNIFEITAPGGTLFHHIDLSDHRIYGSKKYHSWYFLTKDDDYVDIECNRLRSHEIKEIFEKIGFEIVVFEERNKELPKGLRGKLKGRFKDMTDEQIGVTGINCILKKKDR